MHVERPSCENGVVLTCGMGDVGQLGLGEDVEEKTRPGLVPDLENIVAVAAGGLHSVVLDKDGKVGERAVEKVLFLCGFSYCIFCVALVPYYRNNISLV